MAGTALLGRLTWQLAELVEVDVETPRVKTLVFDVPGWPGHRAGQHVDVRLTAEDGYQAERSYSIASAPDSTRVALTVQRLEDGEVPPTWPTSSARTTRSSCAARSAATSSGSLPTAGRSCSSPADRASCR
jgi:Flavodoxin reductases (ferredoxin-NADPH reductases) family 1